MKFIALILLSALSFLSHASGWIQMADFGGVARHRTPMLTIGNRIYTGQGHYNGAGTNILFSDWWEYDPSSNTWTQKADYGGGPCYHSAGFAIGNIGYVGTGRITASGNTLTKDFYKYDPQTNTWTKLADFPGAARRGAVAFAIDGYGYIGTGEPQSGGGLYNDFYRYDPGANSWIQIASMPGSGRVSSVGFELNGYGYVGTGGFSSWGNAQKDFWRYDPTLNSWQQMPDVGTIPRMEASGFSLNGKGYILCGDSQSSGTNYSDMYEFDPGTNQWTLLPDFPGSARRYMATTTLNGVAYAGLGTNGTNFKDFWLFDQTLSLIERDLIDVDVMVFPNPMVEIMHVTVDGFEGLNTNGMTLTVYAINGKQLIHEDMLSTNGSFDVSFLQAGTYFYHLKYNDHLLKTGKLIKQ